MFMKKLSLDRNEQKQNLINNISNKKKRTELKIFIQSLMVARVLVIGFVMLLILLTTHQLEFK
jgi:hypothetical protein